MRVYEFVVWMSGRSRPSPDVVSAETAEVAARDWAAEYTNPGEPRRVCVVPLDGSVVALFDVSVRHEAAEVTS